MAQQRSQRLSRADWTAAALAALAEGGVSAVAIEPLAKRLGATKGSAYWHFANRDDLLAATLERWERDRTDAIIDRLEVEPDPAKRLRFLFGTALNRENDLRLELALLAASHLPVVGDAVHRVAERRMGYLATMFVQAGFPSDVARRRAVLAYSLYLGQAQLQNSVPASLPSGASAYDELLDDALRGLLVR